MGVMTKPEKIQGYYNWLRVEGIRNHANSHAFKTFDRAIKAVENRDVDTISRCINYFSSHHDMYSQETFKNLEKLRNLMVDLGSYELEISPPKRLTQIEKEMIALGITPQKMAQYSGLTIRQIKNIMNGKVKTPKYIETILQLIEQTNIEYQKGYDTCLMEKAIKH